MSSYTRVFESVKAFARHVHDLHNDISKQIQASNAYYKLQVDSRRHHTTFSVRDYVMVRIRPERFPLGSV